MSAQNAKRNQRIDFVRIKKLEKECLSGLLGEADAFAQAKESSPYELEHCFVGYQVELPDRVSDSVRAGLVNMLQKRGLKVECIRSAGQRRNRTTHNTLRIYVSWIFMAGLLKEALK